MARYKNHCYEQGKMIPISFREQILPGTFEYTLSYLIDHELDLSVFDQRYNNDDTGRPAYDPALLLKIVLYGYARGSVYYDIGTLTANLFEVSPIGNGYTQANISAIGCRI